MTLQQQIRSNNLRTGLLLLGFAALAAAVGLVLSHTYDPSLLGVVGMVALVYGLVSWFAAPAIVAGVSGAHPIDAASAPRLHRAIEVAAIGAGMDRTPRAYIIDDPAPNAFAAGRHPRNAYVAATKGLLELMDDRELEAVMAHEMAHVRNRDVRLMTIVAVLVGVIAIAADMSLRLTIWGGRRRESNPIGAILAIVLLIVAPIVAMAIQLALSRRREFLADATAVEITGDGVGMASALAKLGRDHTPMRRVTKGTAPMYIENPLRDHRGLRSSLGGMFDTHPPLRERIERICEATGLDPIEFAVPDLEPGSGG